MADWLLDLAVNHYRIAIGILIVAAAAEGYLFRMVLDWLKKEE